jgi:hypothetical protein
MMPDHRSGAEPQRPAALQRGTAGRICRLPRGPPKSHVTPGNVLRLLDRRQDVGGPRGRWRRIPRWTCPREARCWGLPPYVHRAEEHRGQVWEPVRIWPGVIIGVGDDVARRGGQHGVPSAAQPAILGADDVEAVLSGDSRDVVGGAVVATLPSLDAGTPLGSSTKLPQTKSGADRAPRVRV